jgi:hypothetical protein
MILRHPFAIVRRGWRDKKAGCLQRFFMPARSAEAN